MNGGDIVVTNGTSRRWTSAKGWHSNTKFKNALKFLGVLGAASAVWNIIHLDRFDDQLVALIARAKFISERAYTAQQGGPEQKRLDMIDLTVMTTDYLRNFAVDDTALDFLKVGTMYYILTQMDFTE